MKLAIITRDGTFTAHYSESGLAGLDFPGTSRRDSAVGDVSAIPAPMGDWHILTTRALKDVLAGREPRALPPLDLSAGTEFQQQVWNAMLRITSGRTQSYAQVAAEIGKPRATRAVGGACGANPIPVLVPCHRVLAANHRLGGFSSGLDWKRKLLAREGVAVE